MSEAVDVCIVGAGVAGLTAAHELAERGVTVAVLERDRAVGGAAMSWVEEDVFQEHSWRSYFPIYRNLPDIMSRIPYGSQTALHNLTTRDSFVFWTRRTYTIAWRFPLAALSLCVHVIMFMLWPGNPWCRRVTISGALFADPYLCGWVAYMMMGLHPLISTMHDLCRVLLLLQYRCFNPGERVILSRGCVAVESVRPCFMQGRRWWPSVPADGGDTVASVSWTGRVSLVSGSSFVFAPQGRFITCSQKEGWFDPWRRYLSHLGVRIHTGACVRGIVSKDTHAVVECSRGATIVAKQVVYTGWDLSPIGMETPRAMRCASEANLSVSVTVCLDARVPVPKTASGAPIDILGYLGSPMHLTIQVLNSSYRAEAYIGMRDGLVLNCHGIVTEACGLRVRKPLRTMTSEEFREEVVWQVVDCIAEATLEDVRRVVVDRHVAFDGVRAHTVQCGDSGSFVTSNAQCMPRLPASMRVILAGAHAECDVRVRSMETACKSGKEAAQECLRRLQRRGSVVLYSFAATRWTRP